MRRGVIDIGTNSVKLLVADCHGSAVQPVTETSRQTRLGRGLYESGQLQPEPIADTAEAVHDYLRLAKREGAAETGIIATSAMREAENARELIDALGQTVAILSGDDEARLAYDGVTTNPSLVAKAGRPFAEVIKEICELVDGPVSAEVVATDYDGMISEGRKLAKIADNVAVKLPLTMDGLKACRTLSNDGTMVNVTLCFSANQALLAAKAGATFISPFIGRLDDINIDGMELISDIRTIYDNYLFDTEILAASIRSANHVKESALAGADVATMPPNVIRGLANHPLTDKGLAAFLADAEKAGIKV